MEPAPIVTRDGKSVTIPGRSGELLRLLILKGGVVSKTTIAELRRTSHGNCAGKIRDLRGKLNEVGCGSLIVTESLVGYRIAIDENWHVDAIDFQKYIEALGEVHEPNGLKSNSGTVEKIDAISRILKLWNYNPGTGIQIFERKFHAWKVLAENHLLVARLSTGDPNHVHEAIQELVDRTRKSPTELDWRYLLMAYHANQNIAQINHTMTQISLHFQNKIPDKLRDLMNAIKNGTSPENPFHIQTSKEPLSSEEHNRPPPTNFLHLQEICNRLGITAESQLKLEGSGLTPLECIRRTRKRLYFSGVLASKWVEHAVRPDFDRLLARLDANNGEARFLMVNPKSDAYKRLYELRGGQISTGSIRTLQRLSKQHPSLQVRMFDNLPVFRIVVIDDDIVSFSPYRHAFTAYQESDRGWEAPHIALNPMAPYPLSEAFQLLFEETWSRSHTLPEDD